MGLAHKVHQVCQFSVYDQEINCTVIIYVRLQLRQITHRRSRPSDIQHYTVYNVPDDQHWCFEMLESLSEIRDDNWPMTFNEENSDKAILEENDIEDLAPDNITIFLSRIL